MHTFSIFNDLLNFDYETLLENQTQLRKKNLKKICRKKNEKKKRNGKKVH